MRFGRCCVFLLPWVVYAGHASALPLQAGDFVSLTPWQGEITDVASASPTTVADLANDSRYTLTQPGYLRLQTDPNSDLSQNYFRVSLFQGFDLSQQATEIRFDYSWQLSDPSSDFVQALLYDLSGTFQPLNLFSEAGIDTAQLIGSGQLTVDVSAWAGQSVLLDFLVEDGADDVSDFLQIGHAQVTAVPLPGTLVLFIGGLVSLFSQFHRRGRRVDPSL